MTFFELILLSMGLAVDASCLCTITGLVHKPSLSQIGKIALPFAIFQGIMPMIGYFGVGFLPAVAFDYDHWIAFGLLAILGSNMMMDALSKKKTDAVDVDEVSALTAGALLAQGVSTSMDALAVGITLHSQPVATMVCSVTTVAVITYAMCFGAMGIGRAFGAKFNEKAGILGGLVLMLLGIKLLLDGFFHPLN